MSVSWVACGTCDTKTEGTELSGIELQRSSKFLKLGGGGGKFTVRPFERSPSNGPLAHTFTR